MMPMRTIQPDGTDPLYYVMSAQIMHRNIDQQWPLQYLIILTSTYAIRHLKKIGELLMLLSYMRRAVIVTLKVG
jgi:hypothetical protein